MCGGNHEEDLYGIGFDHFLLREILSLCTTKFISSPSFHPNFCISFGGIVITNFEYFLVPTFLDNCFCNFMQLLGTYRI